MPWWMWVAILGLFIGMIYTLAKVGEATSSSDARADMAAAITNVTIVNTILMLVLGGAAYFYLNQNTASFQPYALLMIHLSLLLSIISVSVSSLHQLNAAGTTA